MVRQAVPKRPSQTTALECLISQNSEGSINKVLYYYYTFKSLHQLSKLL